MFALLLAALLALPPEIQSLLDRAALLPPELHADVVLRLLDAGRIPERKQQWDLLEESLRLAQSARLATPVKHAAGVVGLTDSTTGVLTSASDLRLDRLSLQRRAITKMLSLDAARARDHFLSAALPHPPAPTCEDAAVPRFEPYFALLFEVMARGYTPEEAREGKPLAMVRDQLGALTTVEQVSAAAESLAAVPLPASQRAELAAALTASLSRIESRWRSYGNLFGLTLALDRLTGTLVNEGQSPAAIGRALSGFITRHGNAPRCAEDKEERGPRWFNMGVESFNALYVGKLGIDGLAAFKLDDFKPERLEGVSRDYQFWSTPDTKDILMRLKTLRFGTQEQYEENERRKDPASTMAAMLREEQRRTTEWEASLRAFLNDLENWRQREPETVAAWFHQRLLTARGLLDIVPEGPLRREVWESSLRFLNDSPFYRESPAEWFLQAEFFLRQPDAQAVLPRLSDARLAVLADAGRLLGRRKTQ